MNVLSKTLSIMERNIFGYFKPGWNRHTNMPKYFKKHISAYAKTLALAKLQNALKGYAKGKMKGKFRKSRKSYTSTRKKWGTIAPSRTSIAMYKLPRTAHFKNYTVKKHATKQTTLWNASFNSVSYADIAANTAPVHPGGIDLWTVSKEPIKSQTTSDDLTRVGDVYNIVNQ